MHMDPSVVEKPGTLAEWEKRLKIFDEFERNLLSEWKEPGIVERFKYLAQLSFEKLKKIYIDINPSSDGREYEHERILESEYEWSYNQVKIRMIRVLMRENIQSQM